MNSKTSENKYMQMREGISEEEKGDTCECEKALQKRRNTCRKNIYRKKKKYLQKREEIPAKGRRNAYTGIKIFREEINTEDFISSEEKASQKV